MHEVNIFKLKYSKEFREKFHEGIDEILDEAFLTNHKFVNNFEKNFSIHNEAKFSVATASGTSALETALRATNVKGKYVIIPSNTFIATAVAVINCGAIPIIVDIDKENFAISLKSVEKIISEKGKCTIGALIIVHIGGHITDNITDVVETCEKNEISLIEDCAQAQGASCKNKLAGNFGRFGCFSFFTTKIMTTGEGGMVVCKSENDYKSLKSIRQFGASENNSIMHERDGNNSKMTEIQALMGTLELERVKARIERRREINKLYTEKLNPDLFEVYKDSNVSKGSYYKQIVVLKRHRREQLHKYLSDNKIMLTGGVYYIPLHRQISLAAYVSKDYPNSDLFSDNHICPPCYPELLDEEVKYICETMNKAKF